jgi:hypothetical protein
VHENLFLDANLIWVAPECDDTPRHVCLYNDTHGHSAHSQKTIKECLRKIINTEVWNFLSDLCPPVLSRMVLMVRLILFSG